MSRARALLVLALIASTGCSLSTSANMGSDSSASSESSSRSSASSSKKSAYRDDVRSYMAAFATSNGAADAFESTLGAIARSYGVTNWEDDRLTYVAIGEGLAESGVDAAVFATHKARISRSNPLKMEAIQEGFDTRP